jgi:hypothetical protein
METLTDGVVVDEEKSTEKSESVEIKIVKVGFSHLAPSA